jgi:zona occludens toxin
MIEFITGLPGSGKSYKGVFKLYSNFAKDNKIEKGFLKLDSKTIDKAYTNINELNLSLFDNVYSFNWDMLYDKIKQTYELSQQSDTTDKELIALCKELNFDNAYFLIDECHNYFDRQDKVLIWWLSYHRHLYQDITLITQNLGLVNSKYKAFSEFFYKAYPASKKIFKHNMKYAWFTDSRMTAKSKAGDITVPVNKHVFASYHSGANTKSKNVALKFIIIAVVAILVVVMIFQYLASKYSHNEPNKQTATPQQYKQTSSNNQPKKPSANISDISKTNVTIYSFLCSNVNNICIYQGGIVNYKLFKLVSKEFKIKTLDTVKVSSSSYSNIFIYADQNFIKKLSLKGSYNEKNSKNRYISNSSDFKFF